MLQTDTFWALVGLLLFFVLVVAVGGPKMILAGLDKRTERIRSELENARKDREEARALLGEYRRRRREAEREAEAIIEDARKEVERMTAEAADKLSDMVDRRTRAAETKIAQAEAQAIAEVRSRAADLAVDAAADLLRGKLAGDAGGRMIEASIGTIRDRMN